LPGRWKENSPVWAGFPAPCLSVACWLKLPLADCTLFTKSRSCSAPDADHARTGLAAMRAAARICLIFIGCVPRSENFTVAIGLHGRYQARLFHLLEQTGRAVVAYAQMPLHR